MLDHNGHDLAAALQTIIEDGSKEAIDAAVHDAFPGASVAVQYETSRFSVEFRQKGLLRPLSQAELSDGTLRFLLWSAALLTPRPPALMVLNEPETSLHPDLLPALARLIAKASERTQMWIVTHSQALAQELRRCEWARSIELTKELSETQVVGQGLLTTPSWSWPAR